jgi:hypothetical protein
MAENHLNANTGAKTGLGITLKVMAGDEVNILGKSYWKTAGTGVQGEPDPPFLPSTCSIVLLVQCSSFNKGHYRICFKCHTITA